MAIDKDKAVKKIRDADSPEKGKKALDEYMAELDEEAAKTYSLTEGIEERKRYNQVLKETADLLGNSAESAKIEHQQMMQAIIEKNDHIKDQQKLLDDLASGEIANYNEKQRSEVKLTDAEIARFQLLSKIARGQKKYGKEQKKMIDDIANAIGLTMRLEETFLGSVLKVTQALRAQGKEGDDAREAFKKNLQAIFNWENVALSIFTAIAEQTAKLVKQLDEARAGLAALTGAGYEFSDSMFSAQRQANLFGVSMDEAKDATAGLVAQTANFTNFSKTQRDEMIKNVAMMKKLGIDTATASATIDFFNNNLGMTAEEATKATTQLAMMANEIGISSSKMVKDFQAALPTLAVYGKQSVEVFSNLAAQAKAVNVETSALLGISKQFDTFAGAAEGAGKLNALLGTQLSTTQMLMMTEDERIETLVNAVQAQGVAFGDMDKYTQLAIAHAAGIQDMNEANKIFGMSSAEFEKNKEVMEKNAVAQEKFEKAVAATVPVMTKFKLLATELIIAVEPILTWLGDVAEALTEFVQGLSKTQKAWVVGSAVILTGGFLMTKMFIGIAGAMAAMATGGLPAAGAIASVGAAIEGVIVSFEALMVATGGTAGIVAGILLGGALAMAAAIGVVANAYARMAEAEAEQAKARAKMTGNSVLLAESSAEVLNNLTDIGNTDFSAAVAGMSSLIDQANAFGAMSPKATATLENIALLTVGKAKDTMTNQVIHASSTTVKANVKNVFKGMRVAIRLDNQTELRGWVEDIAEDVALAD